MRWRLRVARGLAVIAATATLLVACSAAPPAAQTGIALIDIPEPPGLLVSVVGHPDASGSQTRRMFYQDEVRVAGRKLTSALEPEALHPGAIASDALTAAIRAPVVRARDPQPGREQLLDDYAKVVTTAARDLDVVPAAMGYWTTYPNGPYRPWVVLTYRLRDNSTGAVLRSGLIGSGPPPGDETLSPVAADDRFVFPTFAALTAEPQRAADGLRATVRKVAEALAARL